MNVKEVMMQKVFLSMAAVAAMLVAGAAFNRTQAAPIGWSADMRAAVDTANPVTEVRWCEYLDPRHNRWVEFWVDGPCLRGGDRGHEAWIARWYGHDKARWRWHATRH
jgi:hypothetical protein